MLPRFGDRARRPPLLIVFSFLLGANMRARLVSMTLAAFLAVASMAWAQQGTSEMRGRVADAQGAALPGVTVVLTNQANGTTRETISGNDGSFIASGMVPGTYAVTAELAGFKKFSRANMVLEVGRTT